FVMVDLPAQNAKRRGVVVGLLFRGSRRIDFTPPDGHALALQSRYRLDEQGAAIVEDRDEIQFALSVDLYHTLGSIAAVGRHHVEKVLAIGGRGLVWLHRGYLS